MKTPRELLFEKHREALPALDQVRRDALSRLFPEEPPSRQSLLVRAASRLWNELILPSRRIWTGLGIAWVFIFGFGLALTLETTTTPAAPALSRETVTALRRQNEEFKQLVQLNVSEPVDAILPEKTQPRSACTPSCLVG